MLALRGVARMGHGVHVGPRHDDPKGRVMLRGRNELNGAPPKVKASEGESTAARSSTVPKEKAIFLKFAFSLQGPISELHRFENKIS